MKIKFPIQVANTISTEIKNHPDFVNQNEKTKLKAISICCNLWYYIYNKQLNDINNQQKVNSSLNYFTNIHSKHLLKYRLFFNNKDYISSYFLSLLNTFDLIEINEQYSTDSFSKSFKINPTIIWNGFTDIEIDFDNILIETKNKQFWTDLYPEYKHLIEDCYRTTVNIEKYTKFLLSIKGETLIKKRTIKIKKEDGSSYKIQTDRIVNDEFILECLNNALKINYGYQWFKISNEGRFYSSLTNLTHTANNFLKIDNMMLYEVDIKNCQPLLLGLILNNIQFKNDTQQGVFYDKLAKELRKERDEVKLMCYRYIFFNDEPISGGSLMMAIDKLYGGLGKEINDLKQNNKLSSLLQSKEAEIMVGGLGKLNINKILKHDACFTTRENISIVKKYLKNYFRGIKSDLQFKEGGNKIIIK